MLVSNRATNILLVALLAVGIAIVAMLASGARGGPLDPPAAPSATGTLPQVEPRNPIPPVGWDGGSTITIGSPGSYFLTRNLNRIPIVIDAENITFDLNGFTLDGSGMAVPAHGIKTLPGTKRNIVVRNGTVVGWGYSCIYMPEVGRSRFEDLHLSACGQFSSPNLYVGTGNVVSNVDSHDGFDAGLRVAQGPDFGGLIENSVISGNYDGILLGGNNVMIRNTVMDNNHVGSGIVISGSYNEIIESRMVGNAANGVVVFGNRNVIVKNQIDGNSSSGISNSGAGNIIGPLYPLGSTTDPNANVGF